ncbi:MAG: DUF6498-containing protein [Planctomycetota bacterium]
MKPSYWIAFGGLLVANLVTIVSFLIGWVTFGEILWSYWCQSVLIGISNAIRMSLLSDFSTEGFTSNDKPVPENAEGKRSTVLFFLGHYGFFHAVYLFFLIGLTSDETTFFGTGTILIVVLTLFFLGSELLVLREQMRIDALGKPNIGSMMMLPYLRIIPMHLTILFGGVSAAGSVIFLGLKLLADLLGHYVDERINLSALQKAGKSQ